MAYDEYLADRIKQGLKELGTSFTSKNMMGGYLFSVDDKMLCGININKKTGTSLLMLRIGEEAYAEEINKPECLPMDFTGRPMKRFIYITPEGFDMDDDLSYWLQLALDFNPIAKASKKRVKRSFPKTLGRQRPV